MAVLGDLIVNVGANTSGFMRQMTSVTNMMNSGKLRRGSTPGAGMLGGMTDRGMTRSVMMGNLLSSAIQSAAGWMVGLGKSAVMLAGQTEQIRLSLEVLSGSKELGEGVFNAMEKIAADTTLTLQETTSAAKQLLVTFDATQIPSLVTMLGNISSGMDNVSLQEMAYLLQTSAEEGKLMARDLRQFTTRGIPLPKALKEVLGLVGPGSGTKLNELISAGEVTMDKTMAAIKLLSETTYKDMLKRQGETFLGRLTQMKDSWTFVLRDFGTMIEKAFDFRGAFVNVTEFFRMLRDNLWKTETAIQQVADTFRAFIGMLGDMASRIGDFFTFATDSTWTFGEAWTAVFATLEYGFTHWLDVGELAMFKLSLKVHETMREIMFFYENWMRMLEGRPPIFANPLSQKELDLMKEIALLEGKAGQSLKDFVQEKLEAFLGLKKPGPPKGLGPPNPPEFDGAGGGGKGQNKNPALMQNTQEAWKAIMQSMGEDPEAKVVGALQVLQRIENMREREDAKRHREAMKGHKQKPVVIGDFAGGGGAF